MKVCVCVYWFPDEFDKYCSDVEHTAAWGGQLEVSCLKFLLRYTVLLLLVPFSPFPFLSCLVLSLTQNALLQVGTVL